MDAKIKSDIKDIIANKCPYAIANEVESVLFDAEHEIIDYCHCEITNEMVYLTSKIACDMLDRNKQLAEQQSSDEPENVKAIKQGDTSIEFATIVIDSNKDIIKRYRSDLNKFRKLVF